jgi:hypothetical protein
MISIFFEKSMIMFVKKIYIVMKKNNSEVIYEINDSV